MREGTKNRFFFSNKKSTNAFHSFFRSLRGRSLFRSSSRALACSDSYFRLVSAKNVDSGVHSGQFILVREESAFLALVERKAGSRNEIVKERKNVCFVLVTIFQRTQNYNIARALFVSNSY